MLIQFRVENHRSLRDEQTFSFVGTSDKSGAHVLRAEGLDEAVVPVVAIYGANASGKSNVLEALAFFRRAVVDSQRRWEVEGTPHEPFLLSGKSKEPSLYEVDIAVHGVRFRYGFQLSASRIEEEWLFAWPHGRKALWFERDGDRFEFGKTLHGENEVIRSLTRPNSLFLSAAAQSNHAALMPLVRHFAAWQVAPSGRGSMLGLPHDTTRLIRVVDALNESTERESILRLLQAADTGIVGLSTAPGADGVRYSSIWFRHRATEQDYGWLPLFVESAGTIALLELAPSILDALRDGGLLCIDELEASLHPALALGVVRLFNDSEHNPKGAQLVFTTHDTNMLGSVVGEPVLRRDQVWFTEKDEAGATHLYPLTDFHPRKEENLERGYLQGRYGAIPFLGELVGTALDEPGGDHPTAQNLKDDKPNGDKVG